MAEIEVVENRDRNQGRAVTDNAVSTAPAHTTWHTATATATEKEAVRSRLGGTSSLVE